VKSSSLWYTAARKRNENQDRGTQILLWLVIALSLTAAGFLQAWLPGSFRWHGNWLRPLSLILMICGIAVRAAVIITLGRRFTANVITQPEQRLQRGGLYSVLRHPSYINIWKSFFWQSGYISRAWPALVVTVAPPTLANIAAQQSRYALECIKYLV
jgi:protein-S-isoprenylcysteine O-methyltransferase Ste14